MSNLEQTLSIIKPDAVERNLQDQIKKIFVDKGFHIKNEKKIQISNKMKIHFAYLKIRKCGNCLRFNDHGLCIASEH